MRTFARLLSVPVLTSLVVLIVPLPAGAEPVEHIVDSAQLMHTVERRGVGREAERAAVREAIGRPEVQQAARRLGVDIQRIAATVDAMDGADLAKAGEAARRVNVALVGGASTVTISTTTIIIALLVVILIIVAVK